MMVFETKMEMVPYWFLDIKQPITSLSIKMMVFENKMEMVPKVLFKTKHSLQLLRNICK